MLEFVAVTLRYETSDRALVAAENISFSMRRGERVVLLGPSGCGKTSILKAAAGFVLPAEGTVSLDGRPIAAPGLDRIMIFQEFDQLLPWKTVAGNVIFALRASGRCSQGDARARALAVLDRVRLAGFADAYPHELSGGMKQRAALARALAIEPVILLMDEPFASLDALTRSAMQAELLDLWRELGFAVLCVTHSIEEALLLGERVIVLTAHPGEIAAEFASEGASRHRQVTSVEARIRDLLAEPARSALRPAANARRRDWSRLLRRALMLLAIAAAWQGYAAWLDRPLLLPTVIETARAWWTAIIAGELPARVGVSLELLLMGYTVGAALAALLVGLGVLTRFGADLLSTVAAIFAPLPGIALLPLAFLWFGLGIPSMVFVLAHSVLWPLTFNSYAGFQAVPEPLRLVGRNYGLRGLRFASRILLPAALPAILTGLRIGWAFSWRTLIAAEFIFGVMSGSGGLGWFILTARNQFATADVFAGLATVVAIGLLMENFVFRGIEARTVRRWGMLR